MADRAGAMDRMAPTMAMLKFTFTNADSGIQAITFHDPANIPVALPNFKTPTGALYVTIKVTAALHIAFGASEELGTAVTNSNAILIEPADGMQDFELAPGWDSFRCKGDSAGGDIYIFPSGT